MRFGKILALLALVIPTSGYAADATLVGINSFYTTVAANAIVQIVALASNLNGISLQTANIAVNPGNGISQIYYGTASSTSSTGATILIATSQSGSTGFSNLPYPLLIPAGYGLYAFSNVSGPVFVTYNFIH
jgi:hypothetical protein